MIRSADAVIFDLGGVVLGWDPARAFAQVLPADQVAAFMTKIDFPAWNRRHDAGLAFVDGEAELVARFPDDATAIAAYRQHFAHTLTGMVAGTSAVIAELQRAGIRLVGLTNWSAETFPIARKRFGILRRLEGIVVSGHELVAKPDPMIFTRTCERYALEPLRTIFVDDSLANVDAARAAGLDAIRFSDAAQLREELVGRKLLGEPDAAAEPVSHVTSASDWQAARRSGEYPWSSRGIGYEAEGFVHLCFPHQLASVRQRYFADLADDELIALRLVPGAGPLVVEDLHAGEPFPHLYAPLSPGLVAGSYPLGQVPGP